MKGPSRGRPPLVAIFGGNTISEPVARAAHVLAEAVVDADALLLTGGDGSDGPGVKDRARRAVAGRGRWVGVAFGDGEPATRETDDGLVVDPALGHQRNLLEACLCDAAIVLPGGSGTVSEALAALGLARPVLLVGQTWAGVEDADLLLRLVAAEPVADADLEGWCRSARDRVRGDSPWLRRLGGQILRPESVRAGSAHAGSARALRLDEVSREDVQTWVGGLTRLEGAWPAPMAAGPHQAVAETFTAWCDTRSAQPEGDGQ